MLSSICELLSSSVSLGLHDLQPFQKSWFCLFTSPFAWGHNGMVFLCSIPLHSKYLSSSPLSVVTDSGKP